MDNYVIFLMSADEKKKKKNHNETKKYKSERERFMCISL